MIYRLDEAILRHYGDALASDMVITSKKLRRRGGGTSLIHHWVDIPSGVLAIHFRMVQHHYETVEVCTLYYQYDDVLNDALKATGSGWFDKRVGGWNILRNIDEDHAEYITTIIASRFDRLVDINASTKRRRKADVPEDPKVESHILLPFHVRVQAEHILCAIRELRPDDDLEVPLYLANGEGYAEWPTEYYGRNAPRVDVMTRYPFLLLCYDDAAQGRRYVAYNVLGRIAERIETGAGLTTRTLFMRIAHTVRESKVAVIVKEEIGENVHERPHDRAIHRGDIPPEVFDRWAAICRYPVPHALCADYVLPCSERGKLLPDRNPLRPEIDAAPGTDLYLRRIADFFGGALSEYRSDSCYAAWPDDDEMQEDSNEKQKPEDDRVPIVIGSDLLLETDDDILRCVANSMLDRFKAAKYTTGSAAMIERIVFHLLGLDSANEEDGDQFSSPTSLSEVIASVRSMGSLPYHVEGLLMLAIEVEMVARDGIEPPAAPV